MNYIIASEKYNDHYLFENCIEISCPSGWIRYLDEVVDFIHNLNEEKKIDIRIGQVKMKWNRLTIYPEVLTDTSQRFLQPVDKIISELSEEAANSCITCGRKLVESVYDSRLVWKCLNHYDLIQPKKGNLRNVDK